MEKTIEKPQRTMEQVTRSNRWLILTVVVLLAVLAALGAWLLVDNLVGNESTVGAETEQEINVLIDDWLTAFSTGDGQLFMDLFTDDGRYVSAPTPYGGVSGEELKGYVERQMGGQFDLVRTGTLIVERPNSYHVALKYRAHEDYDREYYFMLNVAKEDGSLKFRYAEGWQPLGWFQIADGLPPRPVGDPSEIAR